jgi:hypothetical protein
MNPEDAIARQALLARLQGSPMPTSTQVSPQAGGTPPLPEVVPQNALPLKGDRQLGDMDRKAPSVEQNLAKSVLPGTSHADPRVQMLSKALLNHLIPYLGK